MEQEREGEIERLRKPQATTPHRPVKRSRLLEAKLRSKTVSRPPKMTAQLGHFQLLTPRGNLKRVHSTGGSGQTIPWSIDYYYHHLEFGIKSCPCAVAAPIYIAIPRIGSQ